MRKKILIIIGIILLLALSAGGFIFLKGWSILKSAKDKSEPLSIANQNGDQDNDGLLDWQEAIYGTNPKNSDTDGDGYLDGQEVKAKHDPLKPAPNDKLTETNTLTSSASSASPTSPSENNNLTSLLSQSIIQGISTSQNGTGLNPSNLDLNSVEFSQTIDQALANGSAFFNWPEISDQEIKISTDNSKTAVKNYLDSVMAILSLRLFSFDKSDLEAVKQAVENQNFSEIDQHIQAYEKAYQNLKEMTVPSSWLEIHKQGLQMISMLGRSLDAIKEMQNDPFKAMLGLKQYEEIINSLIQLNQDIYTLMQKQGVS